MMCHALILAAVTLTAAADELQGEWSVTSYKGDGKPEKAGAVKVIFQDGAYTLPDATGFTKSRTGRYTCDPAKSPKTIDIAPGDGPNKGKTMLGIYKLDGDKLTACYDAADKGRPTDFTAPEGSGRVLVTYERMKK